MILDQYALMRTSDSGLQHMGTTLASATVKSTTDISTDSCAHCRRATVLS
jgi:hypothetical protein